MFNCAILMQVWVQHVVAGILLHYANSICKLTVDSVGSAVLYCKCVYTKTNKNSS